MTRAALATAAGLLTLSTGPVAAARLGGVVSSGLGADRSAVIGCTTNASGIVPRATVIVHNDLTQQYEVFEITLSGIPSTCVGKSVNLVLSGPNGVVLSTTVVATGTSVVLQPINPIPASSLATYAVVVR